MKWIKYINPLFYFRAWLRKEVSRAMDEQENVDVERARRQIIGMIIDACRSAANMNHRLNG